MKGLSIISLVALVVASLNPRLSLAQAAPEPPVAQQLWVTMHTAPIDDYCAPCIASEKLLKAGNVEFKKVLEPMGPWPWFQLTDSRGNQKVLRGGLSEADVASIKRGEFPNRN